MAEQLKLNFLVESRPNFYAEPNNREWVLYLQLEHRGHWVMYVWDEEPTEAQIDEVKSTIMRAFEFYQKHINAMFLGMELD